MERTSTAISPCRRRARVAAAMLLALSVTVSLLNPAAAQTPQKPTCVWGEGANAKVVGPYLKSWSQRHGLGALKKWGVSLQPRRATITVTADRADGILVLRPQHDCRKPPAVTVQRAAKGTVFPPASLQDLAQNFPAPRKKVKGVSPTRLPEKAPYRLLFLLTALGLVLIAWASDRLHNPWRRVSFGILLAGVGGLCGLAAAPLFTLPFATDTEVLRTAYAAENVFGDWNHPFLLYALNHIPTRFSLEPWALRIVPFGCVLAQAVMLMIVARREGGLVAAALAGVWLACEVRRRQSIDTFADWDLAGALLLGLVWWAGRNAAPPGDERPDRRWLWVGLLLWLGFHSSYLMIVPITVLVALLWLDPRTRDRTAYVSTAVWVVCAYQALSVFRMGTGLTPVVTQLSELTRQMFLELPMSRSGWMWLPVAAGLFWLAWGWRRRDHRLMLGTTVAIPAAVLAAWFWSHVNQGYYVCLITPLLLLPAGVVIALGGRVATDWLGRRTHVLLGGVIGAFLLSGLVLLTVHLPVLHHRSPRGPNGIENLARFEKRVARDERPIFFNAEHMGMFWSYDRARRGVKNPGKMLDGFGPPDVAHRLLQVYRPCRPQRGWTTAEPRFYYVTDSSDVQNPPCKPPHRYRCKRLYKRAHWLNYFECTIRSRKKK